MITRLAALLGSAAVAAAIAGGGATSAANCSFAPPLLLPEPVHTRGDSNTIRWEHVPKSCWIGEDNSGKASTQRRFTVSITNVASGRKEFVTVNGEDEIDATIDPDELPKGSNGEIDGVRFEYVVVRKEKWCSSGSPTFGTCQVTSTRTSQPSTAVRSTQDARRPSASLELASGATFVRSLRVGARIVASDPAGAGGEPGSGAGYVEFSDATQFANCRRDCIQSLDAPVSVLLPAGPDGARTIQGRVYDKARGPADDPGATTIGTPPGNVSAPFQDTVYLDRTAPAIFIRVSTVRVTVGAPVTFDASQSVDPEGSGLQPVSGEWSFGDGGRATGLVANHTYARTGRFPFTFAVADSVGNVARTEGEIEVVATPVAPQPGTMKKPPQTPRPTTVDRRPPLLSGLTLRRAKGRVTVSFRVSERATVRLEVRRLLPKPVRRTTSLSRRLAAGRRAVVLPANATRTRGRYAIVLVARDVSGNVSKPKTLRLTTQ